MSFFHKSMINCIQVSQVEVEVDENVGKGKKRGN